jgi:hypothetical protein
MGTFHKVILTLTLSMLPFGNFLLGQVFKGKGVQVQISEIPRPKAPADLQIKELQFKESSKVNNDMLDAEESATVSFKLVNVGKGDAIRNVLNIESVLVPKGIVIPSVVEIGNLDAGNSRIVSFTVNSKIDLVEGEAFIRLAVKEANGFDSDPTELRFKTQAFKSPQLVLSDAVFTNTGGEGKITLGKTVNLELLIQNRGQGPAKNVTIRIENPDKVFAADKTEFQFPIIEPNGFEKINYEFFANKQFTSNEISIEIIASEFYDKYGFRTIKSVSLDKTLSRTQVLTLEGQRTQEILITDASLVSDVDRNIPENSRKHSNRYALIIGNEDYSTYQTSLSKESNVAYARNDAKIMKEYFNLTLGIPNENIDLHFDATAGRMNQSIDRLSKIIKNSAGNAEIFVYYAGHGLPDENKEPYLIPVDITGANVQGGLRLFDFYKKLTEFPSSRVTVILDACFSGAARGRELLAMRGVRIKANELELSGNLVVYTASSGEQGSLPYEEKKHGIFTYHLLKKLQESNGDISYSGMHDHLKQQVSLNSVLINSKEQNPQLLYSPEVTSKLVQWKFN